MTTDHFVAIAGTGVAMVSTVILAVADSLQEPAPLWYPIMNTSIGAGVLIWFMLRNDKKLEELAKALRLVANALNLSTQGQMVTMLALKTLDKHPVMDLATKIKNEAHDAQHENPDS